MKAAASSTIWNRDRIGGTSSLSRLGILDIGGGVSTRCDVLDREILSEKRGVSRYRFVPDPLGSVRALLGTSGSITATRDYWPYGEVAAESGGMTAIQYVGALGYFTDATGRIYVRARHYRPDLGRWVTVDLVPPGEDESSLYEYAGGTPFVAVDPSGLEFISWCCVKIRGRCYGWCCEGKPQCPPRRRPPRPKPPRRPQPRACPTDPCASWEAIFHSCAMACRQKGDPGGGWCSDCCQDLSELLPDNIDRDAWYNACYGACSAGGMPAWPPQQPGRGHRP